MERKIFCLPNFLYRYCCFDKDNRNIGIIENCLLPCPSPKRFNDPFDCRIRINFLSMNDYEIKKYIRDMINYFNPELCEDEKEKEILYRFNHKEETIDYSEKKIKEYLYKNFGIFSLSAKKNHLLLWSHYTCGHHGFSIEFSTQNLCKSLKDKFDQTSHFAYLDKVAYKISYPKVSPNNMYKIALVKNSVWKYEKEYRIIFNRGADKSIQVPPEVIHSIILGCEIEEENEAKVINLLRKRGKNTILYKATKKSYKFGLDYIQINY